MMEHHFLFYPYRMYINMQGMRIFRRLFLWFILAVFSMLFIACIFIYMISSGMNDGGV
ncbi:hypothetical protein CC082_003631, partial [Salmonella enterica subsp. enterica serovar Weltevreden]|nr:hypothetical protein [Salmonella enterica subsp. enterica serovar Weltevreden]